MDRDNKYACLGTVAAIDSMSSDVHLQKSFG